MLSKMVTGRQKIAAILFAALRKHAERAAELFTCLVQPPLIARQQRDRAARALAGLLVRFRSTLNGVFGPDCCVSVLALEGPVLALEGTRPRDPAELQRLGQNAEDDEATLSCAGLQEAFFRHVGMEKLAGRVPTTRRSPTFGASDGDDAPLAQETSPTSEAEGFGPGPAASEEARPPGLLSSLASHLLPAPS